MKIMHVVIAVAGAMMLSAMPVEAYAELLAGTSGSGEGIVYAYQGGTNWTAISPSLGDAVLDIINFNGTLYAATMSYDLGGEVWRYDGGTSWTVVGDNMDYAVCALEIYKGQLYAGTSENDGKLYRYNGASFVYVGAVAFSGIRAMYSSSYGYLQLGDIDSDNFGRYDETNFYLDAAFGNSCVVDFAEYNNELYAGTQECAYLFGSTNGINWSIALDCPNNTYSLWELEPFQGQLYLGYGNGQLGYMDSLETWNSVLSVSDSIISMAAAGNTMLYFGTGLEAVGVVVDGAPPGYVYAYAGNGATNAALISGPMGDGVQCLYYTVDPLLITPATGFAACGGVGGPFTITNQIFSLANTGTNSPNWSLVITFLPPCTSNCWLDASPAGGTLPAGAATNVTVCLNSNACGLPAGVYTATVWFTNLSDGVGQSRQFTLTVIGPPVITCPGNITVTATNQCETVVNYTVTVSGGCPPYTTNCVPPSGSVFTNGATTVSCSATDSCGRSNSCSFTVTVSPPPPPVITCPGNISVTTCNSNETVVNYIVTVSGGCPPYTTNCVPPSGSMFTIGATTVSCSATDSCGRSNSCNFTVTVSPPPSPVITCPGNISVMTCNSNGMVVNYTVTVSGGSPPITTNCVPPSGSMFTIGATTVNCNATDSCGQSASCSFTVTVLTGAPQITAQPTNQVVVEGTMATFAVGAIGSRPLYFQWRFNGTNLPNGIITTVAGGGNDGLIDYIGPATNASLTLSEYSEPALPSGVAVDASGNLFIADTDNNVIREVDNNVIITTVAGNGSYRYSGDGGQATNATLSGPSGVAVDASGNLFIADTWNYRIREVAPYGIIATVAGNGDAGYSGDSFAATSASLNHASGVAVDASGNLFMADADNNVIRKVDTSGIITTVAGNGGYGFSGDNGPATDASLNGPWGVAVDASGNLFIADTDNNVIRKVDTNGFIMTVAGGGNDGIEYNGPATNARLNYPSSVAVDASGNLFIADTDNNVIREVDTNGIITTVAGGGNDGLIDYFGPATNASLAGPSGVAVDTFGNLFIADSGNNVIREVVLFASQPTLALINASLTNAGDYTVIITNACGSVTSSVATLMVTPEGLHITPPTGFTSIGWVGGPFTVTNETFSLTNTGANSLAWTLVNTSGWLNASSGGGTLTAGGATNVTVSLNSHACSLSSGVYTATVWFTNLNDGVAQSRQFALVATGIPILAIQTATPGLRMFAGPGSVSARVEFATSSGYDVNWMSATGGGPVSYSFTILDSGAETNYFQTQLFLVPINQIPGGPAGPDAYNNRYADWQATNMLWLQILGTNGGPTVTANISWKTNDPNAGPNNVALRITNSTIVGTWTLAFTSPSQGTLTAPGAPPVAFTIADANVATDFAGPVTAYFGVQANAASAEGSYLDYAQISISGVAGGLSEDFLTDAPGNFNPNGYWTINPTSAAASIIPVTADDALWVTWSPVYPGFGLGVSPTLPPPTTGSYVGWVDPLDYDPYDPPIINPEGAAMWALIPLECLPSSDQVDFPGATSDFFTLVNPAPQ